jgi:hypothetical protein
MTIRLHPKAAAAAAVLALAVAPPVGAQAAGNAMHHAMMHHAMKCRRHAMMHRHAMGHCPKKHRR